ncbi:acyl carrier protein [Streptomyces sp. ASQP_92]|uniref:acyl carrier protein n=1 Tax=Streptomyces sp. ASQP_92 TaxID=2979116 RepID=UPI0021C13C6C|nr:acyl carrier protein [Streptomyces sp. ASQP_92]MCT9091622.1 acyl carrier protein [Streptomyces sp. ASQP_92]
MSTTNRMENAMYDTLLRTLDDLGFDIEQATPQTTFRDLEMDSLSLAELMVNVSDEAGVLNTVDVLDMTLGQAAERLSHAAVQQAV